MLASIPGGESTALSEAVWIDLLNPSADEKAAVEAATKVKLPTRSDLEEIESSSRVYLDEGALYLSTPILTGTDCMVASSTTLGMVLTPDRLITQRFAPTPGFDTLRKSAAPGKPWNASDAFLRIVEMIVDYTADALEHASGKLEAISRAAFRGDPAPRARSQKTSNELRAGLRSLGRISDGISHLRDTLLGLGRIATFVHEAGGKQAQNEDIAMRLRAIRLDITSLTDYQGHLTSKLQLLLDATLGFISIQQNDIVKTLTVVSVVGVPPVLIAGIYGMNFKVMPELNWHLGYPLALALMFASAVGPYLYFKRRGWI
jgi:magnesium transporter